MHYSKLFIFTVLLGFAFVATPQYAEARSVKRDKPKTKVSVICQKPPMPSCSKNKYPKLKKTNNGCGFYKCVKKRKK